MVKADNHVRVPDVKEGPLVDWVLQSGLTQEECARIQPTYGFRKPPPTPEERARMEQERVRAQLTRTLRALRRLMPRISKELPAGADFQVQKWLEDRDLPAGTSTLEYREIIRNVSSVPLEFPAVFLDDRGALRQENSWVGLPAGGQHHVPFDRKDLWGFVEWRCEKPPKGVPVQVEYVATQR